MIIFIYLLIVILLINIGIIINKDESIRYKSLKILLSLLSIFILICGIIST